MMRRSSPPHNYSGTVFGTSPMPSRTSYTRTPSRYVKSGISPLAKALWEGKNEAPLQFRTPKHERVPSQESDSGYPFCAQSVGTFARRAIESQEETEAEECDLPISLGRAPPAFSLGSATETLLLIILFFCLVREGTDRLLCLSILFLIVCAWLPITPFILPQIA